MTDVLKRQLDAIDAQIELLKVQVLSLRQALDTPDPQKARLEVPDRCKGVIPENCGVQYDDAWQNKATFGNPGAATCRGCGSLRVGTM